MVLRQGHGFGGIGHNTFPDIGPAADAQPEYGRMAPGVSGLVSAAGDQKVLLGAIRKKVDVPDQHHVYVGLDQEFALQAKKIPLEDLQFFPVSYVPVAEAMDRQAMDKDFRAQACVIVCSAVKLMREGEIAPKHCIQTINII